MTDKQIILTDSGNQVEATAPVIISASRSTDIPAFLRTYQPFMPNGSSTVWLRGIVYG